MVVSLIFLGWMPFYVSTIERLLFVECARDWLGTPFHLNARLLGQGVDCGQLLIAAGVSAGLIDDVQVINNNPRQAHRLIARLITDYCVEVDQAEPGDIYWFVTGRNLPLHLGIATEKGVIHASQEAGKVVETVLPMPVAKIYRLKRWAM